MTLNAPPSAKTALNDQLSDKTATNARGFYNEMVLKILPMSDAHEAKANEEEVFGSPQLIPPPTTTTTTEPHDMRYPHLMKKARGLSEPSLMYLAQAMS